MNNIKYISMDDVLRRMDGSRSTLYAQMDKGLFPQSVKIGKRRVAWLEHEINAMMRAYVSSPSEGDLRAFVKELEAKRFDEEVSNV
ncbi:AlpA family phage regulatory protein [Amylibacter sp.]|nr:AlpA family phage regulatory protein [Amylibacter sp.]MDB9763242.1 AlpA family phage regulatory protein [Amylibacter sp.]